MLYLLIKALHFGCGLKHSSMSTFISLDSFDKRWLKQAMILFLQLTQIRKDKVLAVHDDGKTCC